MRRLKPMWYLWPAFLSACVIEMVVFALVDPNDLHWFSHPLALSTQGVYTIAFFLFWILTAFSSALTLFLAVPPADVK